MNNQLSHDRSSEIPTSPRNRSFKTKASMHYDTPILNINSLIWSMYVIQSKILRHSIFAPCPSLCFLYLKHLCTPATVTEALHDNILQCIPPSSLAFVSCGSFVAFLSILSLPLMKCPVRHHHWANSVPPFDLLASPAYPFLVHLGWPLVLASMPHPAALGLVTPRFYNRRGISHSELEQQHFSKDDRRCPLRRRKALTT